MSALLDPAAMLDEQRAKDLKANDELQAALLKYELARSAPGKGERLAKANDQHALDLQVQVQGCIGWLPV